jgi:hypothetical protein
MQADSSATDFGIMKCALVTELEKMLTLVECKITRCSFSGM